MTRSTGAESSHWYVFSLYELVGKNPGGVVSDAGFLYVYGRGSCCLGGRRRAGAIVNCGWDLVPTYFFAQSAEAQKPWPANDIGRMLSGGAKACFGPWTTNCFDASQLSLRVATPAGAAARRGSIQQPLRVTEPLWILAEVIWHEVARNPCTT